MALFVVVSISFRWVMGPLVSSVAVAVSISMAVIVLATALGRAVVFHQSRRLRDALLAEGLAEGASSEWFGALVGDSRDAVVVVDRRGAVLYQTPSMQRGFGYSAAQLLGSEIGSIVAGDERLSELLLRAAVDPDDRGPHDLTVVAADGRPHQTEITIATLVVGDSDCFVLTIRDVTDRHMLRAALSDSSLTDPLTGLRNREGFLRQLDESLATATTPVAVALVDLYRFRDLNDGHGHDRGDDALRTVGASLSRLQGPLLSIGRLGGDEFGVALASEVPDLEIGRLRTDLQRQWCDVALSDGTVVDLGFSVGYAVADSGTPAAELLERADLAQSSARRSGPLGVSRYEPQMRSALVARLAAEQALREALANDRVVVHYQPVVSLLDVRTHSVEALVRMVDDQGRFVSPAEFVPIAEATGLIHELGNVVLETALRDHHVLAAAAGREIGVAVNVSALQLDPNLHPTVAEALARSEVGASCVTLELTETVLAENQESASAYLSQLRMMGCSIALDDFGTGFSSLAYLAGMPVDILKIDRSFVMGLDHTTSSQVLVRAVVQLARSLGLTTVAEGVETAEQAAMLRALGADYAQGYWYCRPIPLTELVARLGANNGKFTPQAAVH